MQTNGRLFPSIVDGISEADGHYIAGFTDGEGCFVLRLHPRKPPATGYTVHTVFKLTLRADDAPILRWIQSILNCGRLFDSQSTKLGKPQCSFIVSSVNECASIVAPFFRRFPLRAKKRHDFEIWADGVALSARMSRQRQYGVAGGGLTLKWNAESYERFAGLANKLQRVRAFENPENSC